MTPAQLRDTLIALFPEFHGEWEPEDEPTTLHQVMLAFTPFLGKHAPSASPSQLQRLGPLINEAVSHEGPLENAVATCLLEHLHQIRVWRTLKPYLSDLARRKSRA